ARARVAVLPCCHDLNLSPTGGLEGWVNGPLAVDVMRAAWLRQQGYMVITRTIPEDITPKNRLLMGHPETA
ncbi:MAG: methyltransferase domain-containing protein, partial [Desulfosalsimonadaceae bacterium]|nr:methyltransferase domain-containing protein [Desulfosalsimonadaceae bacterium]